MWKGWNDTSIVVKSKMILVCNAGATPQMCQWRPQCITIFKLIQMNVENLEGSFYGGGINWPIFDRQVTSPSVTRHEAFHLFHVDVCVSICVFVCACVCLSGVYCVSGGQLSGCWGRDPSVKWSSSPRWVSNSHNPTGHRSGLRFCRRASQTQVSPLPPASSRSSFNSPLLI